MAQHTRTRNILWGSPAHQPSGSLPASVRHPYRRHLPLTRLVATLVALAVVAGVTACSAKPKASPGSVAPASTPPAVAALTANPAATPAAAGNPSTLPALPPAFHFEVQLRPANAPEGMDTTTSGIYREGAWQQSAQTAVSGTPSPAQESVAISGTTYTRPAGEPTWTRWPGIGFDAAYGLTSPFAVLRLYAVADQKVRGEQASVPGASEPTFRTQAVINADTVRHILQESAAAVAPDEVTRATLLEQVAPLAVTQTINYWAGDSGRIYRATATLLTADKDGQSTPWMQVTWRFWGYDDQTLAVVIPQQYRDAPGPSAANEPLPTAAHTRGLTTKANLSVQVFAGPGLPAEDLAVTVYPAGDDRQPIDWRNQADAQFALPPGHYDVLVQMDYAQQWLRDVEIKAGSNESREVTFDFGTLKLSVLKDGKAVPVDIVTYPAGNRQNWVDWRSDNPSVIYLRAGTYDVEIAYEDYQKHQMVSGLQVKAGATTAQTINLP